MKKLSAFIVDEEKVLISAIEVIKDLRSQFKLAKNQDVNKVELTFVDRRGFYLKFIYSTSWL